MSMILRGFTASIAAVGLMTGMNTAVASSPADFYKDRTVTLLVAFGAGGGFGLYSRLLAEHMSRHLAGSPTIQTQFMPGAGGLKAANYFFNVSPKDGSVMAILSQTAALSQRIERGQKSNIRYDLREMNWLGRLVTMEAGMVGRVASGLTTVDALKDTKVIACAAGKTHQGYINAKSIAESLGFPIQIIVGYPSSSDQTLALQQGECNTVVLSLSTWETTARSLIDEKIVAPLAVVNVERSPFWPDVPTTPELATDADSRQILEFIARYAAIGRAYGLPPGAPSDRVSAMRAAFVATYEDPSFVATAKKRGMPLNPAAAEVVERNVRATLDAPDLLVEKTREMLGWSASGS